MLRMFSRNIVTATKMPIARYALSQYFSAAALDMGGLTFGKFCKDPEDIFDETLKHYGIEGISRESIRSKMGLFKKIHFEWLYALPEVQKCLREKHKVIPTEADMYKEYCKRLYKRLEGTKAIPHAREFVEDVQAEKMPVFYTSGFDTVSGNIVLNVTKDEMPKVQHMVCADQVPDHSRSSMIIEGLIRSGLLHRSVLQLLPDARKQKIDEVTQNVFFATDSATDTMDVRAKLPKVTVAGVYKWASGSSEDPKDQMRVAKKLEEAGAHVVVSDLQALKPALILYRQNQLELQQQLMMRMGFR